jgi:murein DD-endopeptidase MepM/ murein hydrolase activator NlpD
VCPAFVAEDGGALVFQVENRTRMPVLLRADFPRVTNVRASRPLPVEAELGPGERAALVRFTVIEPGRPTRADSSIESSYGSHRSRHDDTVRYAWPFGGAERRLMSQGIGGAQTHRDRAHYAFDFTMPEGTPVLAARAGLVVLVKDGFVRGGLDPDLEDRANTVVVMHDDRSFATYTHLRKGIPVREGQPVAVGERLGWSGSTGYAGGPHLHFQVGLVLGDDPTRFTIPIRFDDGTPEGTVPAQGEWCGPAREVGSLPGG